MATLENALKTIVASASTMTTFSDKYILLFDSNGDVVGKIKAETAGLGGYSSVIVGDLT